MGTFCPKMGTNKGQKRRDLEEVEDIKKRWKEYMEELYKRVTTNSKCATDSAED